MKFVKVSRSLGNLPIVSVVKLIRS